MQNGSTGVGSAREAATESPSILLIDDDHAALTWLQDVLTGRGYRLEVASDGEEAAYLVSGRRYDVIVSDISMPGMDGISLLRTVRETDLDVPVILVTGDPSQETAIRAIEYGAFRYLTKPFTAADLRRVVEYAVNINKMSKAKREALRTMVGLDGMAGDRAELEVAFERALVGAWIAYQPIISWSQQRVLGYEALARTTDPTLSNPLLLIEAAEKLNRLPQLGRHLRSLVVASHGILPSDAQVFVNVHPRDFEDEDLSSPRSRLAQIAPRIVLEITERASLEAMPDAMRRIGVLRSMGFRIAIDDLGAGHAGLTTFARMEPDVAKIDMGLIRHVDTDNTKQKVIRSMASLCRELDIQVISEGVETIGERDALVIAGCDVQQGYLYGRPQRTVEHLRWA